MRGRGEIWVRVGNGSGGGGRLLFLFQIQTSSYTVTDSLKIFMLRPRIEPGTIRSKVNTLSRRCKSWLVPQGSTSVLYI